LNGGAVCADAAWPPGRLYYIKSSVVRRLEEAAIDKYLDCARTMPTPLSAIAFQQLHGAASRVRFDSPTASGQNQNRWFAAKTSR